MSMKFNNFFGLARWKRKGHSLPLPDPTLFGTLVTADDVEHDIGNVLITRSGRGILLDADMVLTDGSTHPLFEAP